MIAIAEADASYRDRLIDLVNEAEIMIRTDTGPEWVVRDWQALVNALMEDSALYQVRFFDSLDEASRSLLLQFAMFDELVSVGRWRDVEEVLLRKSGIAESSYERIESFHAGHIEAEKRFLHEFIAEYATVEAGLKHLKHETRADHVSALLDAATHRLVERESALSPRRVNQQIKQLGPHETLRKIWASRFNEFCEGVETGAQPWLDVAVALKVHADSEASIAIGHCIARAIPSSAEAVLRSAQLYADLSIDDVCRLPPIDQETEDVEGNQAAVAALSLIQLPDLVPLASDCIKLLQIPE